MNRSVRIDERIFRLTKVILNTDYRVRLPDNSPESQIGCFCLFENARRFDVLMLQIMVAKLAGETDKYDRFAKTVKRSASILQQKATIPEVYAAKDTLQKVSDDAFWINATLPELGEIRKELRDLMHFLRREIKTKVINVTDAVIFEREGERFTQETNLESYYERAHRYVEENADEPALHKLKNNIPLDQEDWRLHAGKACRSGEGSSYGGTTSR